MDNRRYIIDRFVDWLHSADINHYFLSSGLPDFLIADKRYPVFAIDILLEGELESIGESQADKSLKLKVKELTRLIPKELNPEIKTLVVSFPDEPARDNTNWSINEFLEKSEKGTTKKLIDFFDERFPQALRFPSGAPTRASLMDFDKTPSLGIELDEKQSKLAAEMGDFVDVIEGPAGSGKTLLLAARAKKILEMQPSAEILFVCFNGALRNYITYLMRNTSVKVSHWHEFSRAHGFRDHSTFETDNSERDFLRAPKPRIKFDAVLVDETQDFWPGWLQFLETFVRQDKFGLSLAGDKNQSLFLFAEKFKYESHHFSRKVRRFNLETTYRTTRQVSGVIGALEPSFALHSDQEVSEGPKVEVVFSDKQSRSNAVLADLKILLENQPEFSFSDCLILVPNFYFLRGENSPDKTLERAGIPTHVVWKNKGKELDLTLDTVKIMTVHSAKGLEFRNVFLLGLDELFSSEKLKSENDIQKVSKDSRLRLLLVGPSRSKERLHIYYSRSSVFIDRLSGVRELVNYQVYPDDY